MSKSAGERLSRSGNREAENVKIEKARVMAIGEIALNSTNLVGFSLKSEKGKSPFFSGDGYRIPNSAENNRALTIAAPVIAGKHYPVLDNAKVTEFVPLYGLYEAEDRVAPYFLRDLSADDYETLEHHREEMVKNMAIERLSKISQHMAASLGRYLSQDSDEAVFVRRLGDILPTFGALTSIMNGGGYEGQSALRASTPEEGKLLSLGSLMKRHDKYRDEIGTGSDKYLSDLEAAYKSVANGYKRKLQLESRKRKERDALRRPGVITYPRSRRKNNHS